MVVAPSVWLFDFDGTAFATFKPSHLGLGVEQFYYAAVARVFGDEALTAYLEAGGLQNRAPTEVVAQFMPEANFGELREWTERLIEVKLALQLDQIGLQPDGTLWPEPCEGFVELWGALDRYVQAGQVLTGIISSGHTAFIEKTWALHKLSAPGVIVSDDDCRRLAKPHDADQWVKPGVQPIKYARRRLAGLKGIKVPEWPDVRYFGDSPAKDGGMARAVGAWFGHFNPECRPTCSKFGAQFPDWRWVKQQLPGWLGRI